MKILNLKFKNINSLAGINEIDFTDPKFTGDGLFAITGKTGAGKSSILDAISLALFGKTPRVEITGQNNDVMTRGTNDCFSEIAFEVGGKKWKSAWKQERTRTGNLKPVNRQIADAVDKIVTDQVRSCDSKIVEILGLTFEQFTKVILLAQGSFAAFLQADKNDKGELLEQITGTEIYGEISKKVFERYKTEKEKLEKILIELGAIKILSEDEIMALKDEIAEYEKQKQQIDSELQKIEIAQKWLVDLGKLQKQITDANAKLPELHQKVETVKNVFSQTEISLQNAKNEKEKTDRILVKVRELDTKITEKNKLLTEFSDKQKDFETAKEELTGKVMALQKSQTGFTEKETALNKKIQELEDKKTELENILSGKELNYYLQEKENITSFGNQIKNLIEVETAISNNQTEIDKYAALISTSKKSEKELSTKISDGKINIQHFDNQINLLDENIKLAKTIQSLDEHRKALEDGKPCPLCGALEHPYAIGNIPQTGEKETELKNLKQQFQTISTTVQQAEKALAKLISDKDNALKNKEKEEQSLSGNKEKRMAILNEITILQPHFLIPEGENKVTLLKEIRTQKLSEYEQVNSIITKATDNEKLLKKLQNEEIPALQKAKEAAGKLKNDAETEKRLAEQQVETKQNILQEKTAEKQRITTEKQALVTERTEIFGDKQVAEEEQRLKNLLENAETLKANAEKSKITADTELAKNQAIISEKEKELAGKKEQKITAQSLEELQAQLDEKKPQSDLISQKIGANRQTLNDNEERLKNSGEKLKEKESQQQICNNWGGLNELIGSADGKKYRNFAQALTFEHLIGLANRQLQRMSERYLLKRVGDTVNPFELSVIDKFQNCEERTAQNLSGGEKFIASLSLALGLANMASKNMPIDTMFIDEGFGTLDSDYLDTALSVLSNLQNEGKIIGVISHLSELKERIATHIEVTPIGNGYSRIEISN